MDGKDDDSQSQREYESAVLGLALIYIGTMEPSRELRFSSSTFCRAINWAKSFVASHINLPSVTILGNFRARM